MLLFSELGCSMNRILKSTYLCYFQKGRAWCSWSSENIMVIPCNFIFSFEIQPWDLKPSMLQPVTTSWHCRKQKVTSQAKARAKGKSLLTADWPAPVVEELCVPYNAETAMAREPRDFYHQAKVALDFECPGVSGFWWCGILSCYWFCDPEILLPHFSSISSQCELDWEPLKSFPGPNVQAGLSYPLYVR